MFLDSPCDSDIETYNVYGTKHDPGSLGRIRSNSTKSRVSPTNRGGVQPRNNMPRFGEDYQPRKRANRQFKQFNNNNRSPVLQQRYPYNNQRNDGFQSDYDYSGKRNRNGHNYIRSYGNRNPDRQVFFKRFIFVFKTVWGIFFGVWSRKDTGLVAEVWTGHGGNFKITLTVGAWTGRRSKDWSRRKVW